jgi:integrase
MEKEELITRNVVAGCDRLYRSTPPRFSFLAPEDVPALLAAVAASTYAELYGVMLYTGLRVGEALALRWTDVDLERATLRVEHSMATVDGMRVLGEPKTEKSRRAVDLPPEAVAALTRQRKLQMSEQARAGAAGVPWLNPHGLIFTASYGAPASDSTVRTEFYRLLKAAGLPPMRLHDLRHSCATIELAAGAPLVAVSEQLGHSKPSITLNVYAHSIPSMRQAVADAMHRALQSG